MPNSSRRKQSKPQHVLNENSGEEGSSAGNQTVTSTHFTAGDQSTQEAQYGSKVTGQKLEGQESGEDTQRNGTCMNGIVNSDSEEEFADNQINDNDALPHDLSLKGKVTENDNENFKDDLDLDDENEGDGPVKLYSPPSEHLSDRFCVYCNVVKTSPADLERHLRKHTGDKPFQCQSCIKSFKSKRSLQYHEYMQHGTEPADSNIAQRYQLLRKRRMEESLQKQDYSVPHISITSDSITSPSAGYFDTSPAHSGVSQHIQLESASKRQRLDEVPPLSASSAITPSTSESFFDLRLARSIEAGLKGSSNDSIDSQDLTRACPVCAKAFPKPSDLKRHMMCHTGEKPFRCEYCNKPFRAKSSMHYHLKATHGLEIELSPGLEERYLRMKTRAQMNLLQRGHLTGVPVSFPYGSESAELPGFQRDLIDFDDIEDDTKSNDSSFYQNAGSTEFADTKSQGHNSYTGNNDKSRMDLSTSDRGKRESSDGIIMAEDGPFRRNKLSIRNEVVLITRLDGLDLGRGISASIYKCYLCCKMFNSLSKMQCHLSLHFERQITSFECCFCDEIFPFKTQLQNHMRRRHGAILNGKSSAESGDQSNLSLTSTVNGTSSGDNPSLIDNHFSCSYCRKAFSNKISLHKHMRLHVWNRNCFCRICGKSFNQYTSLQLHISRFHWKTTGKLDKNSWIRKKLNFFNAPRFRPNSHDGIPGYFHQPRDLIKRKTYQKASHLGNSDVTVVMPQSPPTENGDISDAGASRHSSENNWSETLSDHATFDNDDGGIEIKTAPKRSLLSFRGESSPRSKSSRKSTPIHLPPHNQGTSDNSIPLNFIKSESAHQDSNNNESSTHNGSSPDSKPPILSSSTEGLIPGYNINNLNATSHLLMAKALAAHQTLTQHLNHTSQPVLFPPNQLPPSLAAMSQMMTLPVAPPVSSEAHAGTSKSPSPASYTSSKSDTSPDDKEYNKDMRDSLVGYPRVQWGQKGTPDWTFNMYCPTETNHTDGRKVTSLSRTHSRLGIVHSPVNREAICKPSVLADGRTVYKCPFCSKEFVSFSDINRHMDFHEDIRPYKCQYCDYYARTNSQLKVHMMRHQGIREFCCKLCNYKGVTQSDLNRHMKSQIHMLKSRNACTFCGEGFVTSKNLEKHLDGNCIVKMQKLNGGLEIPMQESMA